LWFTSRDTVEGARPIRAPIDRNDSPAANPREISSRSSSDSRNGDRIRVCGCGLVARRIARSTACRDRWLNSARICQNGAFAFTSASI